MNKRIKIFNFWKENKIAGHFQLTEYQLIVMFMEWLPTNSLDYYEHYNMTRVVRHFITSKLDSVGNYENDSAEYHAMDSLLYKIWDTYIINEEHLAESLTIPSDDKSKQKSNNN